MDSELNQKLNLNTSKKYSRKIDLNVFIYWSYPKLQEILSFIIKNPRLKSQTSVSSEIRRLRELIIEIAIRLVIYLCRNIL